MSTARRAYAGTGNPRQLRAILEPLHRNLLREEGDAVVGASKGPDVVAQLRRQGLELPRKLVTVTDRDGRKVRAGLYSLTSTDRRLFYRWRFNRIRAKAV